MVLLKSLFSPTEKSISNKNCYRYKYLIEKYFSLQHHFRIYFGDYKSIILNKINIMGGLDCLNFLYM